MLCCAVLGEILTCPRVPAWSSPLCAAATRLLSAPPLRAGQARLRPQTATSPSAVAATEPTAQVAAVNIIPSRLLQVQPASTHAPRRQHPLAARPPAFRGLCSPAALPRRIIPVAATARAAAPAAAVGWGCRDGIRAGRCHGYLGCWHGRCVLACWGLRLGQRTTPERAARAEGGLHGCRSVQGVQALLSAPAFPPSVACCPC